MKRTDLSKLVRAKAERESGGRKMARQKSLTRIIVGHTRFATTSKATFDGTHPHQWSPPQQVRVYAQNQKTPGATNTRVENFITHNGDFDFYNVNGNWVELGDIQAYLARCTGFAAPSVVDSAAIAGVVDLLRAQGSFALAARFAVCLDMKTASADAEAPVPSLAEFEAVGAVFERELDELLLASGGVSRSVREIGFDLEQRDALIKRVCSRFEEPANATTLDCLSHWLDAERGGSLASFVRSAIDAFFDNDSFFVTRTFLSNAKGSFGLMVTNSLDAARQLCVAARGQTISVAFYPKKGLICYGSEQAAVKAGLGVAMPGGESFESAERDDERDAVRVDLDDLNGEVCLMDWGEGDAAVSLPNQQYETYPQMAGALNVVLAMDAPVARARDAGERPSRISAPDSKIQRRDGVAKDGVDAAPASPRDVRVDDAPVSASSKKALFHRMTRLEGNEFIKPLAPDLPDLVGADVRDVPRVLRDIQEDWRNKPKGTISLNRLTAWNLSRCLRRRLDRRVSGTTKSHRSVDVVVTGCEVSLWLAEQFAADLANAFPRLDVRSVSANKILGLFGQDLPVPAIGHPRGKRNDDFTDSIVIVVSHSGGHVRAAGLLQPARLLHLGHLRRRQRVGHANRKQLRAVKGDGAVHVAHLLHGRRRAPRGAVLGERRRHAAAAHADLHARQPGHPREQGVQPT
jgi:hypothetical protein